MHRYFTVVVAAGVVVPEPLDGAGVEPDAAGVVVLGPAGVAPALTPSALGARYTVACTSALRKGHFSGSAVHLKLSIVIRRPRTTMSSLTALTKRFIRWKKSARLKNVPLKVKSRPTDSRPGAAAPVVPVEDELPAGCAPFSVPVFEALSAAPCAACLAWPGPLCAVPELEPPAAGAGVGAAVRSPVWILSKEMSVPRAARSSCISRLGMSTVLGTALPRRMTVV